MADLIGVLTIGNYTINSEIFQAHKHDNLTILDKITEPYTIEEQVRITDLETDSHSHSNKTILDNTTASFTIADEEKVDDLYHVYGEVATINGSTGQSIPNGTNWTKMTFLNTLSIEDGVDIDLVNKQITIQITGKYLVTTSCSSYANINNFTLETTLFKNGSKINNVYIIRKFGTANNISTGTNVAIVELNVGDIIDVRCKHNYASPVTLTTLHSNITLHRIY